MPADERRSARLLFADELAAGIVGEGELDRREVNEALASKPVPSPLSRRLQERLVRRGELAMLAHGVAPLVAARRAVLGDAGASGPPRLVVLAPASVTVHGAMRAAGDVPYAALVPPDAVELELLWTLRRDGVTMALDAPLESDRLDRAERALAEHRLHAPVLAPRLDGRALVRWRALTGRFDLALGGPEAVRHLGFHAGPLWRGPAVWLPGFAELDGPPAHVRAGVDALEAAGAPVWALVRIREGDGLPGLAARLAPLARPWEELLSAVERSRSSG